jgi:hypothetical protein
MTTSRRAEWRTILDAEVKRWSALSFDELIGALRDRQRYQVDFESKKYQVEVEVLEITEKYLHVAVAVDDGALPSTVRPLSRSFFCSTN